MIRVGLGQTGRTGSNTLPRVQASVRHEMADGDSNRIVEEGSHPNGELHGEWFYRYPAGRVSRVLSIDSNEAVLIQP